MTILAAFALERGLRGGPELPAYTGRDDKYANGIDIIGTSLRLAFCWIDEGPEIYIKLDLHYMNR